MTRAHDRTRINREIQVWDSQTTLAFEDCKVNYPSCAVRPDAPLQDRPTPEARNPKLPAAKGRNSVLSRQGVEVAALHEIRVTGEFSRCASELELSHGSTARTGSRPDVPSAVLVGSVGPSDLRESRAQQLGTGREGLS